LTGDGVAFVVLGGTILVEQEVPDDSLAPLADAIEGTLSAPYRAAAVRTSGDVWSVVAEKVEIVEIPGLDGDVADLNVVAGERDLTLDGQRTLRQVPRWMLWPRTTAMSRSMLSGSTTTCSRSTPFPCRSLLACPRP
jgi:hypothetical protein